MPAAASYLRKPGETEWRAFKLDVLRCEDGGVAEITTFDAALFEQFGLPRCSRSDEFARLGESVGHVQGHEGIQRLRRRRPRRGARVLRPVLGLDVTEEMGLLTLHLAGGERPTIVYPKPDFEPATYTILNFPVDDIDAAVDALIERGVAFEIYDGFGQDERGVSRNEGGPPIAWFRTRRATSSRCWRTPAPPS